MKSLKLFLLIPLMALVACSNGQSGDKPVSGTANDQEVVATAEQSTGPVYLDKAAFLSKVHNFEASRDWKFEGNRPAIIDFYADWCKPCKMVAPYFEELAVKYQGQIDIYKVNVDQQQEIAAFYGISSIPTFFYVDAQGKVMGDMGYKEKDYFEQRILTMLGTDASPASN